MSAISSIGGAGLSLMMQSISGQQSAQPTASTTSTSSTSGVAGAITSAGNQIAGAMKGSHHHHHGGGASGSANSDFFSKIQQTVTSALQSAKASGSTENPNQIVEDSLTSLLKNMGVGSNMATTSSAANTATPGQTTPGSGQQSFQAILQSAGISPQQFQSDFISAIKDAQNGSVNPATAFSGFPTGTSLDVTG